MVQCNFSPNDHYFDKQPFYVSPDIVMDAILGVDFLLHNDCSIEFSNGAHSLKFPSSSIARAVLPTVSRVCITEDSVIPAFHCVYVPCRAVESVNGEVIHVMSLPSFQTKMPELEVSEIVLSSSQVGQNFSLPIVNRGSEDIKLYSQTNVAELTGEYSIVEEEMVSATAEANIAEVPHAAPSREDQLQTYVQEQGHLSSREDQLQMYVQEQGHLSSREDQLQMYVQEQGHLSSREDQLQMYVQEQGHLSSREDQLQTYVQEQGHLSSREDQLQMYVQEQGHSSSREDQLQTYVQEQGHLSSEEKKILYDLLVEYNDVFVLAGDTLGRCSVYPHRIDTGTEKPIKQQPVRRLPHFRKARLKELLDDLLQKDVIRESASPWASPIVC